MRQCAAPAARKWRHGGTERTECGFDDVKIAVFLLPIVVPRQAPRPSWWQLGGATFKGGFAVDLLQIQPGEISDSRFDCGRAGPALERGRAS